MPSGVPFTTSEIQKYQDMIIEIMESKPLCALGVAAEQIILPNGRRLPAKTAYNWRDKYPEFAARCIEATKVSDNIAIGLAEHRLDKLMEEGNTQAILYFLKTKGKKRGYADTAQVQFLDENEKPTAPTIAVRLIRSGDSGE